MNEQEFRESIDRINAAISPNSCYNILRFISLILSLITLSVAIIAVVYIAKGLYTLYSFAAPVSCLCVTNASWSSLTELWIASRLASKLREAINNESKKYSSRTINPSTWRSGTQDDVSTLHKCCCCSVADSPPGVSFSWWKHYVSKTIHSLARYWTPNFSLSSINY